MKTFLRFITSAIAGFITFYLIVILLEVCGAELALYRYTSLFGLSDRIGDAISPSTFDYPFGRYGFLVRYIVTLGFWTLVFGFLYFRFVFRRRRPAI